MSVSIKGLTRLKNVKIKNIPGYIPVAPGTPLSTNLAGHTMSKLNDGRFLITGGTTTAANSGITANTWMGVQSGDNVSWVASTALPVALKWHAASVLPDGRILITGGTTNGTTAVNTTYLGTVTGDTIAWVSSTALNFSRMQHTSTAYTNGGVMLIAGIRGTTASDTTYYGAISGNTITWTNGNTITGARYGHTTTLLNPASAGRMLIIGGVNSGVATNTARFVTSDGGSGLTGSAAGTVLPTALYNHTTAVLADGRVAVFGGYNGTTAVNSVYYGQFIPSSNTTIVWAQGNSMPAARSQSASATLSANKVMVTGGLDTTGTPTNSVYIVDTTPAISWVTSSSTLPKTLRFSTIWRDGERVSFATGWQNGVVSAETYVGSLVSDTTVTWAQGANFPTNKAYAAKTNGDTLSSGKFAIIGGTSDGSINTWGGSNSVYIGTPNYSGGTIAWAATNNFPTGIIRSTMNVLPDGRMLVLGGYNGANMSTAYFGTISLIDDSVSWTSGTPMPAGKSMHASTVLKDGRILTTGGNTASVLTDICYIGAIDSDTISWVTTNPLPYIAEGHTLVTLHDGRVAFIGGYSTSVSYSPRVYIGTVTGNTVAWALCTASMPDSRTGHMTTVLDDGRIMVIGGGNTSSTSNAYNNIWFGTVNY